MLSRGRCNRLETLGFGIGRLREEGRGSRRGREGRGRRILFLKRNGGGVDRLRGRGNIRRSDGLLGGSLERRVLKNSVWRRLGRRIIRIRRLRSRGRRLVRGSGRVRRRVRGRVRRGRGRVLVKMLGFLE